MKKALIFGASGLIGSHLLELLLANPDYDRITVVVRKPLQINHAKLKTLIGDLKSLSNLKSELVADDVFIALGTTKKATPDEREYYKIDHDYPVEAAKLALENGAKCVSVVTAIGADSESGVFYLRTKGDAERDILALGYPYTHIFQPSMLVGNRQEHRPMEKAFMGLWPKLNPLLSGPWKRYRGINVRDVAKAMIRAAKSPVEKVKIYQWQEMQDLISGL